MFAARAKVSKTGRSALLIVSGGGDGVEGNDKADRLILDELKLVVA